MSLKLAFSIFNPKEVCIMTIFSQKTKLLLSTAILASSISNSVMAKDMKGFYIGAEYGGSTPLQTKIKIDADKKIKVKGAPVLGAKLGYEFHPDFALELTYHQRKSLKMSTDNYNQKVEALGNSKVRLEGNTKIKYDSIGLNMVYNIPMEQNITPYVFLGAGIAKVQFKYAPAALYNNITLPDGTPLPKGLKAGEIKKSTSTVPFVRVGIGGAIALSDNIDLYGDIKTEITGKTKIKSRLTLGAVQDLDDMKQPLGITEALFGLRFKF